MKKSAICLVIILLIGNGVQSFASTDGDVSDIETRQHAKSKERGAMDASMFHNASAASNETLLYTIFLTPVAGLIHLVNISSAEPDQPPSIPESVHEASYIDGILRLVVPKREEAKTKAPLSIKIK